ncbi:Gliding motility-associated ABC transporter ATP-binding protein GldA [hydrothermal vent metagenome]|uniref:Gliding motility-associated ABC transporter ATP-binding protein GldA n=1 Tax=hydrothermal vent metagenome TaxID=652676 RepID=A0A3B1BDP5_9ZZZZ
MTPLIQIQHLHRSYGRHCAVRDLSFELHRGEVLGLLGPNGAGKSSTLSMIAGTLTPSSGEIKLNGLDLLKNPIEAKAGLGYLPENPPLYPELTVDEYLRYCARLHRVPRRSVQEAVTEAQTKCGLESAGNRLIGNLSKGYQQRVGIAQAIIHNPAVVILDEPTVGLDPIQIREIRSLISELGKEHGVILSTHILPEVQAVCDRVLILHEGELAYSSTDPTTSHETKTLLIRLTRPPAQSYLEAIPGITAVQQLADRQYRLQLASNDIPTASLAEQLVQRGWGLEEFTPEQPGLEQIFVRLTTGEKTT